MNETRQESGKRQLALKKAYEISYAVFRIASRIGNAAFKEHLERQALSLLDAAAVENYAWVNVVARAIEYLVRFGGDTGFIHDGNKDVILGELHILESSILNTEKPTGAEFIPIKDIFSPREPLFHSVSKYSGNPATETEAAEVADSENGAGSGSMLGPEIRQSAILQKLRESGNCRMRDLQEILPNYSERTLRYDLQTLTEKNLVERIGSGGPSVYYRVRQESTGEH